MLLAFDELFLIKEYNMIEGSFCIAMLQITGLRTEMYDFHVDYLQNLSKDS